MTKIYLHGILEKEYQKFFCLNLKNASDLIDAIDCNRRGFKARLISLQNKCLFYDIIVNKKRVKSLQDLKEKPERIDLVPAIAGAGIFTAIGAIVSAVTSTVVAAVSFVGQTLQQEISATANARTQSYIFSSKTNLAQQGSFLPIGYGRLKVGSAVVQSCIKSFPLIVPDDKALQSNTFISKSTNIDAPITANSFVL